MKSGRKNFQKHIELRRLLHQYPEVSNEERGTAEIVKRHVLDYKPDEVYESVGGTGLIFKFKLGGKGKTIAFRADLDALPIPEPNSFDHRSKNEGVSHKCGHDGHMSVVCAVLESLPELKKMRGNLVLIFQPAEETGEGAKRFVASEEFKSLEVDAIFGFHNLPGFPAGMICLREKVFSCSSVGMQAKIIGSTSHAAEPENGVNPLEVIDGLVEFIERKNDLAPESLKLATVTHVNVGERTFGISPGKGLVCLTLRAAGDEALANLQQSLEMFLEEKASLAGARVEFDYFERFPATENHPQFFPVMKKLCAEEGFQHTDREPAFRWSEDFGHFTKQTPGAYFGIGTGENCRPLHDSSYDFNDDIIETGARFLAGLAKRLLEA